MLSLTSVLFLPLVGNWFLNQGHWWLCIFLRAFAISFLMVPLTIVAAKRYGVMDMPDKRKLHAKPMPRLGGLAILVAVLLSTVRYAPESFPLAALLAGGAALFVLALVDDARGLSATLRLAVQVGICLLILYSGISLRVFPDILPGHEWLNGLTTIVWVIGLLNAVNFLDGIDGLTGGLGLLCACVFLAIGWQTRQSHLALLTAALAGACLGFLPYNWHRSVTFLGDSGSTLIGFFLASIAVWGSWSAGNPVVSFSTPLLILAIPIFDMTYTTISRIKNGQVRTVKQWLDYTGKDHLHHRLMSLGMTQPQAATFILIIHLILGLGAFLIRMEGSPTGAWLHVIQSILILLVISLLMLLGRERAK
ncbi:MAG: MraY family glycosyltransferase [Elusimicrobiota bacterium]